MFRPQELTVDHNLIDGFREYIDEGASEIYGSDYVEGDPKFVNASGADFHLQQGSPAIDAGSSSNAPSDDFDGNSRPYGSGYDIGAYEYGATFPSTEAVSTPIAPVGPESGTTGASYSYSTGGSSSSLGHPVEYQFDWKGDGTDISLPGDLRANRVKAPPRDTGSYSVKARARCQNDPAVVSSWSDALTVTITAVPLPDLTEEWVSLVQSCRRGKCRAHRQPSCPEHWRKGCPFVLC